MGRTLTIRLQDDLAEWIEETAKAMGVSKERLIRDQLENASREDSQARRLKRLAGSVRLAPDLSHRKGFSDS
ncbi:MAG: ribbon-helix-helix protein, CopG family [Spirochaetaceae bacterium]|nr:ribbon-helix-helix protein, CopG family [Spirochaetaceae bacterium]